MTVYVQNEYLLHLLGYINFSRRNSNFLLRKILFLFFVGDEEISSVLRKANVKVISNDECSKYYDGVITSSIVCTSGADYRGTCGVNNKHLFLKSILNIEDIRYRVGLVNVF